MKHIVGIGLAVLLKFLIGPWPRLISNANVMLHCKLPLIGALFGSERRSKCTRSLNNARLCGSEVIAKMLSNYTDNTISYIKVDS